MREMSVDDVGLLCGALGRTCRSNGARAERQEKMHELLQLLCSLDPNEHAAEIQVERDPRPLRNAYKRIVKACPAEVCLLWDEKETWPERERQSFYHTHLYAYQQQKLESCFPRAGNATLSLGPLVPLMAIYRPISVLVLSKIAEYAPDDININDNEFMDSLVLPLVKHLRKRKSADGELQGRVWGLILECLKKWPQLAEKLVFMVGWDYTGIMVQAILWWTRTHAKASRAQAKAIVQSLLESAAKSNNLELYDMDDVLCKITSSRRYELLCMLLRHQKSYGFDIESPTDADKEKLKNLETKFPVQLFTMIPTQKALDLLDLLVEVQPYRTCIAPSAPNNSILSLSEEDGTSQADVIKLRCHLRSRNAEETGEDYPAKSYIESIIDQRIHKANTSRDWSGRAFWAKSALFLCIAYQSAELYSKTLQWARRFDKDRQTVHELYSWNTLATIEGLNLLCGIPILPCSAPAKPTTAVRAQIEASDKIIMQLLDAAAAGLREPDIPASDYASVGKLVTEVVRQRFLRAYGYQRHMHISDDEIYDLVWRPTIDMLIKVESFALQEAHEPLNFGSKVGMLNMGTKLSGLTEPAWKFLDNLAQARDELWYQTRVKRCPDVLSLSAPWPKGLPAHCLCPVDILQEPYKLPYVVSRAMTVVFADPKIVLCPPPKDTQITNAIQKFTDNYKACLDIYINGQVGHGDLVDKNARKELAWSWAVERLTGARMTKEESSRFWSANVFEKDLEYLRPESTWGSVPESDNPREPIEWNPGPAWYVSYPAMVAEYQEDAERELEPMCLDIMLLNDRYGNGSYSSKDKFSLNRLKTVPPRSKLPLYYYKWNNHHHYSKAEREGVVARMMLCVNSRHGTDTTFLMQPFPSADDARFPALYLADEFLEGPLLEEEFEHQLKALRTLRDTVPVDLFTRLAQSVLRRLQPRMPEDKTTSAFQAIRLVGILSQSDRPSAACPLIRDVVMDLQGDSAWHRHVFNAGFLSSLSARDAKLFMEDMADAIIERVQAQAKTFAPADTTAATTTTTPSSSTSKSPSAIKVTTIKMLAEILHGANFIDKHAACSILVRILAHASHIDIRVAVLGSLFGIFNTTTDDDLRCMVIDAFRTYAVPAAASLNERRPMTEEAWAKAEGDGGELPEIGTDAPILSFLLDSEVYVWNRPELAEWKAKWATALVMKTLELSIKNSRRWMTLFMKKNDFSLPNGETLPAVPVVFESLGNALENWSEYISAEDLGLLKRYIMTSLSLPPGIAAINAAVRSNADLAASDAGKYWLKVWDYQKDHGTVAVLGLGADQAATLLNDVRVSLGRHETPGITAKLLQDWMLEIADLLIYSADVSALENLVQHLAGTPERIYAQSSKDLWTVNSLPVMEEIVRRIDSLRTDAWQKNAKRRPMYLPDTFKIKIKMLRFPVARGVGDWGAPQEDVSVFVEEVRGLINELLSRHTPYHWDWVVLKKSMIDTMSLKEHFLPVACELGGGGGGAGVDVGGDDDRMSSMAEFLAVELASDLVELAVDPSDADVLENTRKMLLRWRASEVEVVRERARGIIEKIKGEAKKRHGKWDNPYWARAEEKWNSKNVGVQGGEDGDRVATEGYWGDF
ncbi:hypothetical protein B0T17DRAFT_513615 [Bombardia bombarda]|uniref:Uncharacterized protein n=1 Tax=Bombardia bombarda TaxID=252184 RepID=A0AA40CEK7_9PEZI|nr:hypothetical protein B0T17DRAFT_513615 [Bombardia bombarda]